MWRRQWNCWSRFRKGFRKSWSILNIFEALRLQLSEIQHPFLVMRVWNAVWYELLRAGWLWSVCRCRYKHAFLNSFPCFELSGLLACLRIHICGKNIKNMKAASSHQISRTGPANFFPWNRLMSIFFHVACEEQAREIVRGAQQRGRQMAEAQLQVPALDNTTSDFDILC